MTDLTLDPLAQADLAGLLAVTASSNWAHTADDWAAVLHAGSVFGHRHASGAIVSTAAIFSYGSALATIGMVVVKPECRGQGLARALMLHCLALRPAPVSPTILIATPFGLPLYQQLGFKTIAHVARMTSSGRSRDVPRVPDDLEIAPLQDEHFAGVRELDAATFGVERPRMLEARLRYARRASVLRDAAGTVVGFAMAMPQRRLVLVGPVVAPDADGAAALVADVVAGHQGAVAVDVPTDQTGLMLRLSRAGFTAGPAAPVMIHGGDRLRGDRQRLFAIPNRAFC